ncbi:hypothetical protein N9H93_00285 [Rhizobiaceae bacterium]|nr:hypothetical protein [Rhizobiaceae bacterium]
MRSIAFYICMLGLLVVVSLVAPMLVALIDGEPAIAGRFAAYMLLGGFFFGGPAVSIVGRFRRLDNASRLLLMVIGWVFLPLPLAVPFFDMGALSPTDALFEAVSALTTAGSTTIVDPDIWPRALLFYRAQLQFIGGYLALITVVLIVAPLGLGGLTKRRSTFGSGGDVMVGQGSPLTIAGRLGLLYLTFAAFCTIALFLSGHRIWHAVGYAMSATSTGGFVPFEQEPDVTLSTLGMFILALFIALGATSVFWQRSILDGRLIRLREHRESYSVLLMTVVLGSLLAGTLVVLEGGDFTILVRHFAEGLFNAASLVATNGLESRPGVFALLPLTLVIFVILIGGSAYSTSGGLKLYRVGGMLVQSWSELDRLIFPNGVQVSHFGSQRFGPTLMRAIWSFFVAALITVAIMSTLLAATGLPFEAALLATVANFATAGPVYEAGWEPLSQIVLPLYRDMGNPSKWLLCLTMLLGRMEIIALLALASPRYWRSR